MNQSSILLFTQACECVLTGVQYKETRKYLRLITDNISKKFRSQSSVGIGKDITSQG